MYCFGIEEKYKIFWQLTHFTDVYGQNNENYIYLPGYILLHTFFLNLT